MKRLLVLEIGPIPIEPFPCTLFKQGSSLEFVTDLITLSSRPRRQPDLMVAKYWGFYGI